MIKGKRVLIGTSAGINSAAVIVDTVELIKKGEIPSELHLYYIHINQHSPDSEPFVNALVAYAQHFFPSTKYRKSHHDVLNFFEEQKMIPHPTSNVCSRMIKTENIDKYKSEHNIEVDLIGYVRQEKQRIKGLVAKVKGVVKKDVDADYFIENGLQNGMFESIQFPTAKMSDDECFDLVKKHIGWYPAIYDILWMDERILPFAESLKGIMPEEQRLLIVKYATQGFGYSGSKRVFNHNNCLPCKNMQTWQFWLVKLFYPEFFDKAVATSKKIASYYGRSESDYEAVKIYTSFGREDYEVGFEEQSCGTCQIG